MQPPEPLRCIPLACLVLQDHARQAKAGGPGAARAQGAGGAQTAAAAEAEESDSSSDGEDDDDGVLPDKTDAQILETLIKIRQRDQSIYDTQAKFYSSSSEGEEEEEDDEGGWQRGWGICLPCSQSVDCQHMPGCM